MSGENLKVIPEEEAFEEVTREAVDLFLSNPYVQQHIRDLQADAQETEPTYTEKLRSQYPEDERERSLAWVEETFRPMMFLHSEEDTTGNIYFAVVQFSDKTYEKYFCKWGKLREGAQRIISVESEFLSLYYISIILDDELDSTQKIRAMIDHATSEDGATQHYDQLWQFFDTPEFIFKTRLIDVPWDDERYDPSMEHTRLRIFL